MEKVLISELMEQQDNVLVHFNPNHDALGRFASGGGIGSAIRSSTGKISTKISSISSKKTVSSGGESKTKKKKSRKQKQEEVKISRIRDEKTARERKAKASEIVNSGNAKLIYQNKSDLTDKQLKDAINRIGTEKDLRALVAEQNPSKMQKLTNTLNKASTFADNAEKGIRAYNQVARVANAFIGESEDGKRRNVLPYIGEAKNSFRDTNGISDANRKLINSATTIAELQKAAGKFNNAEAKYAAERSTSLDTLRKNAAAETKYNNDMAAKAAADRKKDAENRAEYLKTTMAEIQAGKERAEGINGWTSGGMKPTSEQTVRHQPTTSKDLYKMDTDRFTPSTEGLEEFDLYAISEARRRNKKK